MLIFDEMKNCAQQKIQRVIETGRAVSKLLKENLVFPFTYIPEEISDITREIAFMPLEDITSELLEDYLSRFEIISFSANLDAFEAFPNEEILNEISDFKEHLSAAADFFGNLSDIAIHALNNPKGLKSISNNKHYDHVFGENTLLFYLKGETEKLEPYLNEEQRAAFATVFNKLKIVIRLVNHSYMGRGDTMAGRNNIIHEETALLLEREISQIMSEVYETMKQESVKLGVHGAPIEYIAEELKLCGIYRRTVILQGL